MHLKLNLEPTVSSQRLLFKLLDLVVTLYDGEESSKNEIVA